MKSSASMLWRMTGLASSIFASSLSFGQVGILNLWSGYGGNAQHTGQSVYTAGAMNFIQWSTPMDTSPTYTGNELLIHFGEPGITPLGNVIIPVRHGSAEPFTIEGHEPIHGTTIWSATTSYVTPPADWTPSVGPVLLPGVSRGVGVSNPNNPLLRLANALPAAAPPPATSTAQVAWPESGGRVSIRSNADTASATVTTHAFYGDANYTANQASMDANVMICTPLTAGPDGSVYFGYYAAAANSFNLTSGLAVLRPNGTGQYITVGALSGGDSGISQVQFNCAPALSSDGSKLYIAVSAGAWGRGYLVGVNTSTLTPACRVQLMDPLAQQPASLVSDGTSSPMIAPDGSVFFGVLENTFGANDDRGWLLHYDATLTKEFTPGEFGWDITPTVVPSSWVSGYKGSSSYLIATKYNNYAEVGGDGVNKVAILDPSQQEVDAKNGVNVMLEIETLTGQTPDTNARNSGYPNAVKEWCINSIAVDMHSKTLILNSEDGWAYTWNVTSNSITSQIQLTSGIGEAYTSTCIGVGGNVYAISNATLYAINASKPPPAHKSP